jgi:hypothetical protein
MSLLPATICSVFMTDVDVTDALEKPSEQVILPSPSWIRLAVGLLRVPVEMEMDLAMSLWWKHDFSSYASKRDLSGLRTFCIQNV